MRIVGRRGISAVPVRDRETIARLHRIQNKCNRRLSLTGLRTYKTSYRFSDWLTVTYLNVPADDRVYG